MVYETRAWTANWAFAKRLAHRRLRFEADRRQPRTMTRMLKDLQHGRRLKDVAFVVGDVEFRHNLRGNKTVPTVATLRGLKTRAPVSLLACKWRSGNSVYSSEAMTDSST